MIHETGLTGPYDAEEFMETSGEWIYYSIHISKAANPRKSIH